MYICNDTTLSVHYFIFSAIGLQASRRLWTSHSGCFYWFPNSLCSLWRTLWGMENIYTITSQNRKRETQTNSLQIRQVGVSFLCSVGVSVLCVVCVCACSVVCSVGHVCVVLMILYSVLLLMWYTHSGFNSTKHRNPWYLVFK